MSKNIVTPWSFSDGREYIVSLSIADNPKSLSFLVTDRITAEEWSCHYDLAYVENLTTRTGSFKPFDTFISMIKSAILKKSDAVSLEFFSMKDLENIKQKKWKSEVIFTANIGRNRNNAFYEGDESDVEDIEGRNGSDGGDIKKRYLIVTYVAAFDRVHYPLPMIYSGLPNPTIMQNNIRKLKALVSSLQTSKLDLEQQLLYAKCGKTFMMSNSDDGVQDRLTSSALTKPTTAASAATNTTFCNNNMPKFGNDSTNEDLMNHLMSTVHRLEQQVEKEKEEKIIMMKQLQEENAILREKLETSLDFHNALKEEMKRIRAHNKEDRGRPRERVSRNHHRFNSVGSGVLDGLNLRRRSYSSEGRIEVNRSRSSSSMRGLSPGNSRVFNPTSYIAERNMKREQIAQMRISNVMSRLGSSTNIGNKSRLSVKKSQESLCSDDDGGDGRRRSMDIHGHNPQRLLRRESPSPVRNNNTTVNRGTIINKDLRGGRNHTPVNVLKMPQRVSSKREMKNHRLGAKREKAKKSEMNNLEGKVASLRKLLEETTR